VSFTAPANLYKQLDRRARYQHRQARLVLQELPGDDWDADHNQERIQVKTRLNPDPKHVKWISSALPRNEERE